MKAATGFRNIQHPIEIEMVVPSCGFQAQHVRVLPVRGQVQSREALFHSEESMRSYNGGPRKDNASPRIRSRDCGRTLPFRAGSATALLMQARNKVLDSVRRLPKYTCLETINRRYYIVNPRLDRRAMTVAQASSCSGDDTNYRYLSLDAQDRLRVEVAVAGAGEIHSWPGAGSFDSRPIDDMIPGPISSGSFGTSLVDVFAHPDTQFKFIGRRNRGT